MPLFLALGALLALIPAAAGGAPSEELPDPLERGPYATERLDPFKAGLFSYQEPHVAGNAPSGSTEAVTFQIRGQAFVPVAKPGKSPVIVLVHGNHGSCDSGGGSAPNCTIFKRNDSGYAYMAENLATWGYSVFSLDQDQLMSRQDGVGKGMHARRLLISALLDALYKANEVGLPTEAQDPNFTIGKALIGKLDFTRIGLMGHSRGGDAVSSFVDWNRVRPSGRRYPLRAVISLAPVNYERSATYGVPFMGVLPWCDGDVSNLQGARIYERSQHVAGLNPYPTMQSSQLGGNHNFYNSVWFADSNPATGSGDDSNDDDPACNPLAPTGIRLSGQAGLDSSENYVINNGDLPGLANKLDPTVNTRISGDPARMGDQEKIGLATMGAFFRRYVGGEGAFEPYLTGELSEEGKPQIPLSACPTSPSGKRMPCIERVSNSFFSPSSERLDVIAPEAESPLALSSLGTKLSSSGFSNPYPADGGVPVPPTTASGIDWCNPEPIHSIPSQVGFPSGTLPVSNRPCPLPNVDAVGGQKDVREDAPVNHSYGRQLALAWEDPVAASGKPATLGTTVPAAAQDVSGFKALAMAADVNFFDPRNPDRTAAYSDPSLTTQDFTIALTDADGNEGTVAAGDPRYGNALHQTTGNSTEMVHIVLDEIRVPLEDFAKQGVDLSQVRSLELRFGEAGKPKSGSIQLADIRFQESVEGTDVLLDSTEPNAGPGEGAPEEGPNPITELQAFDRTSLGLQLPDVTMLHGANVWTVDDDKTQCPSAGFTKIQAAVDQAAPWDTIVICPGLYEESSTPLTGNNTPSQSGSTNGLTITKPLKIKGAGADKVTIRPAADPDGSLAGTAPYLRDGGGNVITISRQSFGSTDDPEMFVDISGVTVESPSVYAEAGVSFFDTAGRISDSVVGPLKAAATAEELAAAPHGWGIVVTNHMRGAGPGTVLRRVTVDDSKVYGYQSGGILFDDAKGPDATPANTEPSGIKIAGYVNDTIVEGLGSSDLFPQTGIQYHAGAYGFISNSSVVGNLFPADQAKSVGVLLTGAETSSWSVKGSLLAGNGYGVFNANITNTAISEAAPALSTGNFWGTGGAPVKTPTVFEGAVIKEGISADLAPVPPAVTGPATVTAPANGVLGAAPTIAAPGAITDVTPTGSIVDPGDGVEVEAGVATEPVVLADDDFGVKSVALTADGEPVATVTESPYVFGWTPGVEEEGETVTLEATIVDSSGQTATSSIEVEVAEKEEPPVEEPPVEEPPVKKEPPVETPPAAAPPEPVIPPVSEIALGQVKRLASKGTAMLKVTVPGPGKLVASGPKVKKLVLEPKAAGARWITVEAKGAALETLAETGKVTVKVTLVFTPTGGTPFTQTRTVVLLSS
ncbi:MAG TPA: Ig-like domain-containing protein [Solirubrobacterales bacterium]|nr:Ig-like domain-containing protein [Solirubrobacterales bacterium]